MKLKLYYNINTETHLKNSKKTELFNIVHGVFSDKNLKNKIGVISFHSYHVSDGDNYETILQSNYTNIILDNGARISYNYIRDGLKKIKTKSTYTNTKLNKITRKYINRNLREIKLECN